jgi:hypothetical protein
MRGPRTSVLRLRLPHSAVSRNNFSVSLSMLACGRSSRHSASNLSVIISLLTRDDISKLWQFLAFSVLKRKGEEWFMIPRCFGPSQTMPRSECTRCSPGCATRAVHHGARSVRLRNWNRFAAAPQFVAGSPLPPHQSAAAVPRDELQAAPPDIVPAMHSSSS